MNTTDSRAKRCPKLSTIFSIVLLILGMLIALVVVGYRYIGLAMMFFGSVVLIYKWLFRSRGRYPKLARWLSGILSAFLLIGTGYFIFLEILINHDARTDTSVTADYIVVLGAGVNGTYPSLSLQFRLVTALDYLNEHPETMAVLSGGQGPGEEITEAQCMHNWLVEHGISPTRLLLEERSTSTWENLVFSKNLIDSRNDRNEPVIGVLSSEYHLHRAKLMAVQAGFQNPIGIAAKTSTTLRISYSIREAFGLTYYYVFGY